MRERFGNNEIRNRGNTNNLAYSDEQQEWNQPDADDDDDDENWEDHDERQVDEEGENDFFDDDDDDDHLEEEMDFENDYVDPFAMMSSMAAARGNGAFAFGPMMGSLGSGDGGDPGAFRDSVMASLMNMLFSEAEAIQERQSQAEAIRASQVKCPLCNVIHVKVIPKEARNDRIQCSHHARICHLNSDHACPICWDDIPKESYMINLPCGHVVCQDDFVKLGGKIYAAGVVPVDDGNNDQTNNNQASRNNPSGNAGRFGVPSHNNQRPAPANPSLGSASQNNNHHQEAEEANDDSSNYDDMPPLVEREVVNNSINNDQQQRANPAPRPAVNSSNNEDSDDPPPLMERQRPDDNSSDQSDDDIPPLIPRNNRAATSNDSSNEEDTPPPLVTRSNVQQQQEQQPQAAQVNHGERTPNRQPPGNNRGAAGGEQRQRNQAAGRGRGGGGGERRDGRGRGRVQPNPAAQNSDSDEDSQPPPLLNRREHSSSSESEDDYDSERPPALIERERYNSDNSNDDDGSLPELIGHGNDAADDSSDDSLPALVPRSLVRRASDDSDSSSGSSTLETRANHDSDSGSVPDLIRPRTLNRATGDSDVETARAAPTLPPPHDPYADMSPLKTIESMPQRGTWVFLEDGDEYRLSFVVQDGAGTLSALPRGMFPRSAKMVPGGPPGSVWIVWGPQDTATWNLAQVWSDINMRFEVYKVPKQAKLMGDGIGGMYALLPTSADDLTSNLLRFDSLHMEGRKLCSNIPSAAMLYRGGNDDDSLWMNVPYSDARQEDDHAALLAQEESDLLQPGLWHFTFASMERVERDLSHQTKLGSSTEDGCLWAVLPPTEGCSDEPHTTKLTRYTKEGIAETRTVPCEFKNIQGIMGYRNEQCLLHMRSEQRANISKEQRWKLVAVNKQQSLREICDCPSRAKVTVRHRDIWIWKRLGKNASSRRTILHVSNYGQVTEPTDHFVGGTMLLMDAVIGG